MFIILCTYVLAIQIEDFCKKHDQNIMNSTTNTLFFSHNKISKYKTRKLIKSNLQPFLTGNKCIFCSSKTIM